ncbi:hypothetical protein ACIGKR_07120 [Rhodococcus qingshengii]|uniref:hypothetical protein n=1 Tax=Rhodococcus qingshengii TaxID=334542 RepID=UPI0037C99DA8
MRTEAKNRIEGWRQNAYGIDNFHVKLTSRESDLWFASSACIDGRTVRLDIYDPVSQRSTQGVMVEVRSDSSSNLALAFQQLFEDAWRRARNPGPFGFLMSLFRKWWLPLLVALGFAAAVIFADQNSAFVAFAGGVAAGLVANYLPQVPHTVSVMADRLRR